MDSSGPLALGGYPVSCSRSADGKAGYSGAGCGPLVDLCVPDGGRPFDLSPFVDAASLTARFPVLGLAALTLLACSRFRSSTCFLRNSFYPFRSVMVSRYIWLFMSAAAASG